MPADHTLRAIRAIVDAPVWDVTVYSKNRDRLIVDAIAARDEALAVDRIDHHLRDLETSIRFDE